MVARGRAIQGGERGHQHPPFKTALRKLEKRGSWQPLTVMQAFRAAGDGWQTRIDVALKDWLRMHSPVQ
jgi:hypothetical protein